MTKQEKPIVFIKTQVITPCSFCDKCGQDLFVCDSCNKDLLDCEDIYCAEKENFHICEKCMNKNQKQQQKEAKQKK